MSPSVNGSSCLGSGKREVWGVCLVGFGSFSGWTVLGPKSTNVAAAVCLVTKSPSLNPGMGARRRERVERATPLPAERVPAPVDDNDAHVMVKLNRASARCQNNSKESNEGVWRVGCD